MRTVKIEDLPLTTNVAPTDEILVIQNGEVKRALVSTITQLDVSSPSSSSLSSPSNSSSASSSSSAYSTSSSSASSSPSSSSLSGSSSASSSSSGSSSPSSSASPSSSGSASASPSGSASAMSTSGSASSTSEPIWNGILLNEDLDDLDNDGEPDNWTVEGGTLDTYEMGNGNVKGDGGDVTIKAVLQPSAGLTSGTYTVTATRVDSGSGGVQLRTNAPVTWSGATNQNGHTQDFAWSPAVNQVSSFTFTVGTTPITELTVNTGNGAHIISSITIVAD